MKLREPPGHWARETSPVEGAHFWRHKLTPLTVARSYSRVTSGDLWVHVSVSRPDRPPTWDELSKVKNEFIGEEAEAYQVLAKKSEHVNVHSFCLHLWSPVDGKPRVANLHALEEEIGV